MDLLRQQYQLVSERRSALFEYCETILPGHFNESLSPFGNKSMCGLLVHVTNAYRFWIAHFAATADEPFVKPATVRDVQAVRHQFWLIDVLMNKFFELYEEKLSITAKVPGRDMQLTVTTVELATHVITHEFHHKGQVLSISRFLGYTPVDTDLIRF
jgi:uncharacterized damage-inducible protein DinB